jgi:hypothetical protein
MFVYTSIFAKIYDSMVAERKLYPEDFEELEQSLLENIEIGDVIPGMGGLRKVRLKSATKGKRGGFRIDYLDFPKAGITYFVVLYPKNIKDDLTASEKKIILTMINIIKKGVKYE